MFKLLLCLLVLALVIFYFGTWIIYMIIAIAVPMFVLMIVTDGGAE